MPCKEFSLMCRLRLIMAHHKMLQNNATWTMVGNSCATPRISLGISASPEAGSLVVEGLLRSPREHCPQGVSAVFGKAHILQLLVLIKYGKNRSLGAFWHLWPYETLDRYRLL